MRRIKNKSVLNKRKVIIFFDGDGTLWYPKKTKRSIAPHWIYRDTEIGKRYLEHMMLTPSALKTLKHFKKLGIQVVALSTHPHSKKEADLILDGKIRHFRLESVFDEVYTSRDYPEAKGEAIVRILKKKGIPKSRALMVGDSYRWDYLSAKHVGVDALLIKSDYMRKPRATKVVIEDLSEIQGKYPLR